MTNKNISNEKKELTIDFSAQVVIIILFTCNYNLYHNNHIAVLTQSKT